MCRSPDLPWNRLAELPRELWLPALVTSVGHAEARLRDTRRWQQALEAGTMVMTLPQLAKAIRTDLILPDTTLAHLAAACTTRMAEITEAQARRAAAQSTTLAGAASKAQGAAHQGRLQLR